MSSGIVHIVCLCAAWCRLCDDYAPVFERVTADLAGDDGAVRRHWIDIEDEAELVGDFDVETFPTVVVIGPDGVRFAGAVAHRDGTARRALRRAIARIGRASVALRLIHCHPSGESCRAQPPKAQRTTSNAQAKGLTRYLTGERLQRPPEDVAAHRRGKACRPGDGCGNAESLR